MTNETPHEGELLLCRTADDVRQNHELESDFAAEMKRIRSKRPKKRKAAP